MTGTATAETGVSTPGRLPISTGTKCFACGSVTVHEVPTDSETVSGARARRVEHLWSCETSRNQFRLVDTSDDRHETNFDE